MGKFILILLPLMCLSCASISNFFCDEQCRGNRALTEQLETQKREQARQEEQRQEALQQVDAQNATIKQASNDPNATMALEKMGDLKSNTCYASQDLGYTIIQKIDDHHYELLGDGIAFETHAMLETANATFSNVGHPIGIAMKHVGDKSLQLKNGFSAVYQIWRECEVDRSTAQSH